MIPSIFNVTFILGQKDRAVYTLVAYSISLQTLVCVYNFRLQDGRDIISLRRIFKVV